MELTNDARGWIMTAISGVACVLGASVICADLVIRLFPGKRDFRIQDSDVFLSASLSLSFGVMLFSALYHILPNSKASLQAGGYDPKTASWILIAFFMAGVVGIQILSSILHRYMPSHVVDCDHSHEDEPEMEETAHGVQVHDHAYDHDHDHMHDHDHAQHHAHHHDHHRHSTQHDQRRAHIHASQDLSNISTTHHHVPDIVETPVEAGPNDSTSGQPGRPQAKLMTRGFSFGLPVLSPLAKETCDEGVCHGFTDPCGDDCFKIVQARARGSLRSKPSFRTRKSPIRRMPSLQYPSPSGTENEPLLGGATGYRDQDSRRPAMSNGQRSFGTLNSNKSGANLDPESQLSHDGINDRTSLQLTKTRTNETMSAAGRQHHHHVPTNAFLSIGLQTSIAIALHKLPEGFITFATNHANPALGFSVFLALFVHNITEGFAMALPLYLALDSRWKAMAWALVLGGFSQPVGAGCAAIWFHLAGSGSKAPGDAVYGAMFAVTSGIMTNVAMQLFSESLDLTHNRNICKVFAFIGMAIMGMSSALTAS